MVFGVIRNFQKSLKYRGGWKGLLEHMYTVSLNVEGPRGGIGGLVLGPKGGHEVLITVRRDCR